MGMFWVLQKQVKVGPLIILLQMIPLLDCISSNQSMMIHLSCNTLFLLVSRIIYNQYHICQLLPSTCKHSGWLESIQIFQKSELNIIFSIRHPIFLIFVILYSVKIFFGYFYVNNTIHIINRLIS
jgi:hypothetical protein